MSVDEGMEPLERLLNLVGLLLETEYPMTFEEIRRTLPAYGGDNLDSAKRKFERDKDILREYGVPLEMAATDVVVDVYGVVFRGGHWYLVGHDQERDAVRAFRLSRCTTELEDVGEGTAPPPGFRAIDHVEAGPWLLSAEDRALVATAPGTVVLMESTFPGVVRERTRDDG